MLTLTTGGCKGDDPLFPTEPSVETTDEYRISYFNLDPSMHEADALSDMTLASLKHGYYDVTTFPVEIKSLPGKIRCGLRLGVSDTLADGEYLLTFSDVSGTPWAGMLKVLIEDNHVVRVATATSDFSLRKGSGTKDDPYQIGSERDFLTFLDDLRVNELTNGRGVYFRQTADITLMDQSSTKPGRGYYGYSFAGNYDGGGYALMGMFYRGAEDSKNDSRIGIFPTLLDQATVANVRLTGVNVSNTYSDTGVLAGVISGNVNISNVEVSGTIISEKASNVGAIAGRLQSGSLHMDDVRLKATVIGNSKVGGLIGKMEDGYLGCANMSTPDSHFSVEGYEYVGGVIGDVVSGNVEISGSCLSHVVSREDADIRIISCTGGGYTGGLIGNLTGSATFVSLTDVTVECPVGGMNGKGDRVGGLVGSVTSVKEVLLNGCRVTSIVSGRNKVGGYFGHYAPASNGHFVVSGNSSTNYIIPDDSAAGIEGASEVGGVYGYFEGNTPKCASRAIRVGINVDGSGNMVGGIVGKICNSTLDMSIFNMTSTTMTVTGAVQTGGVAGYAEKTTLTGGNVFNYAMSGSKAVVPASDSWPYLFLGTVKGTYDVGGFLGGGYNVSLKAAAVAATVIGLGGEHIGGITGRVTTVGDGNCFEDLVSNSVVKASDHTDVAGICGRLDCDYYVLVHDCINYGDVQGGSRTGGIIGYINKEWDQPVSKSRTAEIKWCVNKGNISGDNSVGGIAAEMEIHYAIDYDAAVQITKCGNHGKISSGSVNHSPAAIGGIVGLGNNGLFIDHCSNSGRIVSTAAHKAAGGIAGSLGADAKTFQVNFMNVDVYGCINSGTIDSQHSSTHPGGILGFMEEGSYAYLRNCLNTGDVLHSHSSDAGGILGYVDHLGLIGHTVNKGNVEHGNAAIGTHKSGSIFYHEGLYYLDGTGKSWPDATKVSAGDFTNTGKFPLLNFSNVWEMTSGGPVPRDCPF